MNSEHRAPLVTWEYCFLMCTPMTGIVDGGAKVSYQLISGAEVKRASITADDSSPLAVIGQLFEELGQAGWELVTYDSTTNKAVFKRPRT